MPAPRGVCALLASFTVASATIAATLPPGPAAIGVAWTPSAGRVVAEGVTGGASASDEYVEIANAGPTDATLAECELVYVTASGSTVTRKASFVAPSFLVPGQHLLVANAAGIYGPLADATYTGGLAADGGAVALRRLDGTVIDAVGWGTAVNAFVEGTVAPAPPAKSSLERLPGGASGNTQDTNDNRTDFMVQPNPVPQSLVSTPVPGPTPSTSPGATATPTGTPSATPSLTPTPTPSATPSATQTPTPIATSTSTPTPSAAQSGTPEPTPTPTSSESPTPAPSPAPSVEPTPPSTATPAPTLEPTVAPTPTPTPTPTPEPTVTSSADPTTTAVESPSATASPTPSDSGTRTIANARIQPVGTRVHVEGVVTVEPGIVGSDVLFAIQDETGGIFVHFSTPIPGLVAGRTVDVEGTLAAPYGQLEIRNLLSATVGPDSPEPTPALVGLADIGESTEGSLVTVDGTVTSVTTDSGRLTITVGDGTSAVRVLADPPAGVTRSDVARGDAVFATGIVGQHATASGRLDGYRLWLRSRVDLVVSAPEPTPPPSKSPGRSSAPSRTPSSAPVYHDLASALTHRGAGVDVVAAVTATAGLLDIGSPTIVVDDGTAAVAVVLPGGVDAPSVGMRVRVTGKVGRWETGATVLATSVTAQGVLQAVGPRTVAGALGSSLEWRLVRVCGRIDRFVKAGVRWRADLIVAGHKVAVLGEPAAAISLTKSSVGRLAVVTGIVRRATSDSSTFQLLPRMSLDIRLGPAPSGPGATDVPSSARSSGPGPETSVGPTTVPPESGSVAIASLAQYAGRHVTVAGLVTDTATSTATIDDGTGEVRIGGASAAEAISMLEPGDAIEVTGLVRTDGHGLILEVDGGSLVDAPGDRADPTATDGSAAASSLGATPTSTPGSSSAASVAAAASMLRTSSAATPPDAATLILVLLLALSAVAAAAVAGTSFRLGRIRGGLSRLVLAVQMSFRRLGVGRREGP